MSFNVVGFGTAVPTHQMSQEEALALAQGVLQPDAAKSRLLETVYRRTGVRNRHTCVPYETAFEWASSPTRSEFDRDDEKRGVSTRVRMQLYAEHAPRLAKAAAQAALDMTNCEPGDITHLVTVSCTGFDAPGVDAAIIRDLGLPPETERVNVGFMGCHGAINGLRVAAALGALDVRHRVLLCAVELCSLHYYFDWVPDKLISNALFADGAAALVGSCGSPEDALWRVVATGSCLLPDSLQSMTWKLGDYGFEMSLSSTVPDQIAMALRPWLTTWLARQGLRLEEVQHWAIHPGGPRIVAAVEDALELSTSAASASLDILAEFGNMSSPTVLFVASRLQQRNATGPCVLMAFGPGLFAEVALIQIS